MGRNHLCEQAIPKDPAHLLQRTCVPRRPSGLSFGFPKLSPSRRQLDYVLLARPPRYSPCGFRVRLACLIHAANVRSEPGSNPSLEVFIHSVASPDHPDQRQGVRRLLARPRRSRTTASKPRSHAFFRGHPECQRSLATPRTLPDPRRNRQSSACEGGRR